MPPLDWMIAVGILWLILLGAAEQERRYRKRRQRNPLPTTRPLGVVPPEHPMFSEGPSLVLMDTDHDEKESH